MWFSIGEQRQAGQVDSAGHADAEGGQLEIVVGGGGRDHGREVDIAALCLRLHRRERLVRLPPGMSGPAFKSMLPAVLIGISCGIGCGQDPCRYLKLRDNDIMISVCHRQFRLSMFAPSPG